MGQYFKAVNITKEEYVSSYDYENGAKLMEHSWIGNKFVGAVECMLIPGGQWYRNKIVWAGDYMDKNIFVPDRFGVGVDLYDIALDNFKSTKPRRYKLPKEYRFIVNHSKDEYIDRSIVPESHGWKVNPLSILLSSGNGRGGGDYHVRNDIDAEYVGAWAGDEIGIESERPPFEYNEIKPDFFEDMS